MDISANCAELEIRAILESLGKRMNPPAFAQRNLPPVEMARGYRDRSGFVFLDSSLPGAGSLSMMAWEPDLWIEGCDWQALENELAKRAEVSPDLGYPTGAAIGTVDFNGQFCFGFYDHIAVFSHDCARWLVPIEESPPRAQVVSGAKLEFSALVAREDFIFAVEKVKEYIRAGDIYQACISYPYSAKATLSAWDYYERLRHFSPAPFAAWLAQGHRQITSASPECFLRMAGRRITTRPIKGTRPRCSDTQHDQRMAYDLITSPKEIAELIMITDLERNDLGRVCEYGSISVPELLRMETYEQVFHLVSTVQGHLRDEVTQVQALRQCFPGGSISGAPKKRALEIIAEVERFPRGLYTGALGYFGYNGESQFSVAIRTAIFEQGRATFHAGAGIVADSEPEREWEETQAKASGLLLAAEGQFA